MKLFYSSTSPYSAKVLMAARHLGIEIEAVPTKTDGAPEDLIASNPLGKIPVLLRGDDRPIYDSVAIMQFLNRSAEHKLYPRNDERRTEAETLEALCDGITDCLLAIVYEKRFRPPEKVYQPWIDRQWEKAARGLDHLNANPPGGLKRMNGGHFAMAAMLGYLELRFAGEWEKGRDKLKGWQERFEKAFPDYPKLKPQAPAT